MLFLDDQPSKTNCLEDCILQLPSLTNQLQPRSKESSDSNGGSPPTRATRRVTACVNPSSGGAGAKGAKGAKLGGSPGMMAGRTDSQKLKSDKFPFSLLSSAISPIFGTENVKDFLLSCCKVLKIILSTSWVIDVLHFRHKKLGDFCQSSPSCDGHWKILFQPRIIFLDVLQQKPSFFKNTPKSKLNNFSMSQFRIHTNIHPSCFRSPIICHFILLEAQACIKLGFLQDRNCTKNPSTQIRILPGRTGNELIATPLGKTEDIRQWPQSYPRVQG